MSQGINSGATSLSSREQIYFMGIGGITGLSTAIYILGHRDRDGALSHRNPLDRFGAKRRSDACRKRCVHDMHRARQCSCDDISECEPDTTKPSDRTSDEASAKTDMHRRAMRAYGSLLRAGSNRVIILHPA